MTQKSRLARGLGRGLSSLIAAGTQTATAVPAADPLAVEAAGAESPHRSLHILSAAAPTTLDLGQASHKTDMVTLTQNVIREIAIQAIERNPHQPRRVFSEATILELSESIRSEGLLQPILVRKKDRGYELIAGERRLRACVHLGFVSVPARVIEASDASSAIISLIENLQRENLNPIDEALGLMSLMQDFGLTQEAVAGRVGKNRATVANALRLLQLDKEVQGYLSRGLLSTGHAKVILSLEDKAQQTLLARKILESGMSVRDAEKAVKNLKQQPSSGTKPASHLSPANKAQTEKVVLERIQKKLSQHLSAAVNILHGPKRGKLVIEYRGNDDLDRILSVLGLPPA